MNNINTLWEAHYSRYHSRAANYLKKEDAHRVLFKDAAKIEKEMEQIKKRRPDLFSLIEVVRKENQEEGIDTPLPDYILALPLAEGDRRVLEKYICDWELLHLLEVALETRVKDRYKDMLHDLAFCGLSEKEAAGKYGVTARTVRRIRQKGIEALRDELMLRRAVLPELFL